MIEYKKLKEELEKEGKNLTKYFTKEVYETYRKEKEESFKTFLLTGSWGTLEKSEQTAFYLKNGYGWCRMLEIIYENTSRFRIDFYENEFPYGYDCLVERKYMHFENRDLARKWAEVYNPECIYEIIPVER